MDELQCFLFFICIFFGEKKISDALEVEYGAVEEVRKSLVVAINGCNIAESNGDGHSIYHFVVIFLQRLS